MLMSSSIMQWSGRWYLVQIQLLKWANLTLHNATQLRLYCWLII